ncbi:rRNA maturation RNase YbeY [Propionivibrio sp.]|uniref:rRNA maturation RNase YbeY n=1 Tax=Propionivibrio sp. TaxID=2212460 RepID=UPI0025FA86EB|nr:rRNA maturation RNase YbeY [Propionivibrio sp.]MBK7357271.1 rRNA maturation RNase YbeY [Propionivibrio sp.]MBK8401332.1 rRNA maturation RNase YbeY [Propionivibrio sp.]MBK8745998.1 rRNA maturation RNase YbeY [Propionivibrio sp.]MBK8892558.1 rRNA maturation RNase YbeY [Propionivibrio sp.]MBL0208685.1 rRNA maturation RNase YbeY [Propionivibrio sp.]
MISRRLNLCVQYACDPSGLPLRPLVRACARAALSVDGARGGRITVRFVGIEEGQSLNRHFRGKDYATNVLSFPYETEPVVCGDLVICAPVVEHEADEQSKAPEAHFAHLIVHGVLHLLGYDHEAGKKQARLMEKQECAILAELGYTDPYCGIT